MKIRQKAAILDAIIEEYGKYAEHLATGTPDPARCSCDLSVGHICEECTADQIIRRVAGVSRLYRGEVGPWIKK